MVAVYCDRCAEVQDGERLQRKVSKYVAGLTKAEPNGSSVPYGVFDRQG